MDENLRTVWCGNLSEKVTEDLLYELFLQGGPIEKVSIPKDRDGKQRTYGFVTYKHTESVPYALDLFDGTALFNRILSMKTRNNVELPQPEKQSDQSCVVNNFLQLGHQMTLANFSSNVDLAAFGMNMLPSGIMYPSQIDDNPQKDTRKSRRAHPYHRENREHSSRDNDRYQDHKSTSRRNKYGYSHSREHERYNYHSRWQR